MSVPARRSVTRFLATALVAAVASSCGGAPAPSRSAPATASPTPPSAAPSARATPGGSAFSSTVYPYRAVLPADLTTTAPTLTSTPWDGAAQIDSTGPLTDRVYLPDSRLLFVYGAPTDLDLAAYADAGQRLKATWHGCPETPDSLTDTTFAGTPALVASFTCGGLHLLSLYTVHDDFGLVVNLMSPPGTETDDAALFARLVADWAWEG